MRGDATRLAFDELFITERRVNDLCVVVFAFGAGLIVRSMCNLADSCEGVAKEFCWFTKTSPNQ